MEGSFLSKTSFLLAICTTKIFFLFEDWMELSRMAQKWGGQRISEKKRHFQENFLTSKNYNGLLRANLRINGTENF